MTPPSSIPPNDDTGNAGDTPSAKRVNPYAAKTAEKKKTKEQRAAERNTVVATVHTADARRITSGTWAKNEDAQRDIERVRSLREQLAGEMPEVIAKTVQMAKAGDVAAARVLIERCIPVPKPVEQGQKLSFDYDATVDKCDAILRSVTAGEIGISAGSTLLAAMAQVQTARLQQEFNERVAELEKRAGALTPTRTNAPTLRISASPAGAQPTNGAGH